MVKENKDGRLTIKSPFSHIYEELYMCLTKGNKKAKDDYNKSDKLFIQLGGRLVTLMPIKKKEVKQIISYLTKIYDEMD